ncbi:MAG: Exodeoxyribonuclease 7 large subunit [Chlamydiales bacterium]|nr:Exodeoxyribonuclease 7 large subunit [Chlamydiales bacterium]MCH9635820.1 Exodeoxyribonuclease 7 large subunit [Chlamydiales bacterium]
MSSKSTPIAVSELTFAIKNQLESRYREVLIQGEISNFKKQASGHLYFDLKDSQAKISCAFFKNSIWPGMKLPKEGDSVIIKGSLSVYPPHGKYQIIVRKMELAGIGELLAKLQELKEKLRTAGYFEKKRELPAFPKTIGVITSPTGAVIQDIINVLSRRLKKFHLLLHPVRVQGDGAAKEIADAIATFNRHKLADVLIVGRGGGSLEDLWPFNEEVVAKAIFESEIPVVSAVGHETDVTIADFVADVRAPTPSAAAELVSKESERHLQQLGQLRQLLERTMEQKMQFWRTKLEGAKRHPLFVSPYNLLAMPLQRYDELKNSLDQLIGRALLEKKMVLSAKGRKMAELSPLRQLGATKQRLQAASQRMDQKMQTSLLLRKEKLKKVESQLHALDPRKVLKRGYSILLAQKENSVIVSACQLKRNDRLRAILSDGERELVVDDEI